MERSEALTVEIRQSKLELLGRLMDARRQDPHAVSDAFGTATSNDASPLAQRCPTAGNVVGVGYGAKVTDRRNADEPALRVYVVTKLTRSELSEGELVPPEINGTPTDVIAVGDIFALGLRPVRCGVSIGHRDITAGTLGCLLRTADDDRNFILSNNHVLANVNQAELGDPIMEPGPRDGGVEPIAELSAFEPIKLSGPANLIDAAIAQVLDPADVLPEIERIGLVQNPPVPAALNQSVRKHGRTTQHTVGVVEDLSADIWVQVAPGQMAWFEEQLGVQGAGSEFSAPGDSGSLIVDGRSRAATGLLFAGGDGFTFANPIEPVLDRFDATIIGEDSEDT